MKRFYPDFESLNAFTLSLNYHQDKLACTHCTKNDQFVSHGIIYKQRSSTFSEKVGKRIFCSNRYGRKGCGRTFQLFVASEIPCFRYGAAHLFIFITALLENSTICDAYHQATGQSEYRNAWRWLKKILLNISEYRSYLRTRIDVFFKKFSTTSNYLIHCLPTLSRLFFTNNNGCLNYQLSQQKSFL